MSHERSERSRIPSYSPKASSKSSSVQPHSGHLPPTSSSRKTSSWHPGQVVCGDCMRDVMDFSVYRVLDMGIQRGAPNRACIFCIEYYPIFGGSTDKGITPAHFFR